MTTLTIADALNRFGLGARADEPLPENPRFWLLGQFDRYDPRPGVWAALPTSGVVAADYVGTRTQLMQAGADASAARQDVRKAMRRQSRDAYLDAVQARATSAFSTPAPFMERLVHFWSNHFAVSADKAAVVPFVGSFEAEAIRPHVLGRFEDMLLAVVRHPAMLLYLDQAQSAGPESQLAMRAEARNPARKAGLNENLAREIMELHTLGVRTGYTQADVTEFARALTGWTANGLGRGARADDGEPGRFAFRAAMHEPGTRQIRGKAYPQPGEAQARAVLHDLATAPQTATHIATKLARHFVVDDPPPALVGRLAASFQSTGGDLPALYRLLVDAPESAAYTAAKFKTPWEWLVSSARAIGLPDAGQMQVAAVMQQLGQPVWRPGSPAGYDDIAATWAAPAALMRRVEVAQRMAGWTGGRIDPRALGGRILPQALGAGTAAAVARAESLAAGLALLLVSPEFQRR